MSVAKLFSRIQSQLCLYKHCRSWKVVRFIATDWFTADVEPEYCYIVCYTIHNTVSWWSVICVDVDICQQTRPLCSYVDFGSYIVKDIVPNDVYFCDTGCPLAAQKGRWWRPWSTRAPYKRSRRAVRRLKYRRQHSRTRPSKTSTLFHLEYVYH